MSFDLTPTQLKFLLSPIDPYRIAERDGAGGRSLSYVEAWDIKRHLIRVFGFGGWSAEVTESRLVFETFHEARPAGPNNKPRARAAQWEAGYLVTMSLTVKSGDWASYTESAVGSAMAPDRGDAHDNAVKSGASDALKRCAINLGDAFGLSLYNGGSLDPVVGRTLVSDQGEAIVDTPVRPEPSPAATAEATPDSQPEAGPEVQPEPEAVQEAPEAPQRVTPADVEATLAAQVNVPPTAEPLPEVDWAGSDAYWAAFLGGASPTDLQTWVTLIHTTEDTAALRQLWNARSTDPDHADIVGNLIRDRIDDLVERKIIEPPRKAQK